MFRFFAGSFVLLSLLSGCEVQSTRPASADFLVSMRSVVDDDRMRVWELEVVTEEDCRLIVAEGDSDKSTVWIRPSSDSPGSGRIVIAASLVPGDECQKGTLTFLSRVHTSGGYAGGPSVYQVDDEGLEKVVTVELPDDACVFGTPIQFGKVNGQNLTLTVAN